MKNDGYNGKHVQEPYDPENPVTRRAPQNFRVNISDKDLATGSDYISKQSDDMNSRYNLDNFASEGTQRTQPYGEKFQPRSEEINSFSNNTAKNTAMRNNKAELRHQKRAFRKSQKAKDRNNRNIFRLFWFVSCLVVGVVIGQYLLVGFNDFLAVNRTSEETVIIEFDTKPDIDTVADTLVENGVINSKTYFKLFSKITDKDGDFRQGTFEIAKNLDYQAIISFLQSNSNRSDIVTVQFTEGMNAVEIANKLKENGVITDTEEFLNLCNTEQFDESFTFLQDAGNDGKYYRLEGYLYPDTYDFYINEEPETVIWKFINNYENRVYYEKNIVPGYNRKIAIGRLLRESPYTVDEIMVIASIIQAEALNTEDMYNVSSVIHNRLQYGVEHDIYTLDCDSTVFYPYRTRDSIPADLTGYVSRYNTYNIQGLPAGPICNPGRDAIIAALVPNDTDYLYFCHSQATDETPAQAYYASNIYDHQHNLELAGLVESGE